MKPSDLFTPKVREGLRACHRDGAVLRSEIGLAIAKKLVEIGLAEGEEGMIALTEPGKVAWTLLTEIEALKTAKARMVKLVHEGPRKSAEPPAQLAPETENGLGWLKGRGMTCGTTNTTASANSRRACRRIL